MISSKKTALCILSLTTVLALGACQMPAQKTAGTSATQAGNRSLPSLVVTNDAPPEVIYRRGSRDTVLADDGMGSLGRTTNAPVETLVTRKVAELDKDLTQLSRTTDNNADRLKSLQEKNDAAAAKYYEVVALINTELQAGTTPGNPILVERWNVAQDRLQTLAQSAGYLNGLATDLADEASRAAFLQENVRAAYSLSGAVKEDHVKLRALEDSVNQNIVMINRLLTSVSDEITRRASYLRSENLNLQTLSLAIARGELYGQNLTNSLYKKASEEGMDVYKGDNNTNGSMPSAVPPQRRPLVIIRFDRPNVNYEQALYSAVGQALEKYPAARFDLVAISSTQGNPAENALASTEARKNGEAVLRSLGQMGLPLERVNMSAATSKDVRNSEVHLFIQ